MGGAQVGVVAGRDADLDREEDRVAVLADPVDDAADRGRAVLARHRVLHLGEADAALVDEDTVAVVDGAAAAREPAGEAGQGRDRPRQRLAGRGERLERPVLQHDVVEEGGGAPTPSRRRLDPVALQHQRPVGVGEGEELEVVVGLGELLEAVEHLLARARRVDPLQDEGGDAAEGDGADRAQRADPDPRRPQQLRLDPPRSARARCRRRAPARRPRLAPRCWRRSRRSRGCRSRSRRRRSARRCRRGSPAPGRARRARRSARAARCRRRPGPGRSRGRRRGRRAGPRRGPSSRRSSPPR